VSTLVTGWSLTDYLEADGTTPDRLAGFTVCGWVRGANIPFSPQALTSISEDGDVTLMDDYLIAETEFRANVGPIYNVDALIADWTYVSFAYSVDSPFTLSLRLRIIQGTVGSLAITDSFYDVNAVPYLTPPTWTANTFRLLFSANAAQAMADDTQIAYWRLLTSGTVSDAQLLAEAASSVAILPAWGDWPLIDGDLSDISGNSHDLLPFGTGVLSAGVNQPPIDLPVSQEPSALFFSLV
jgi:hypothetical protein